MATFPDEVAKRLTSTIAKTQRLANSAHQRLNTLGSQVSALQPGDWTSVVLEAGWVNMADYIGAQVRYQGGGMAHLIGHISGGTTTSGTVIGTVAAGFYNPNGQHAFTANVLAGAATVAVAGTVTGSSDNSGLADGTVAGSTTTVGLTDGTMNGNSGTPISGSTVANHYHGGGSYAVQNGQHYHASSSMAIRNGQHTHGSSELAPSTPVNYNTVTITMTTSGQLVLTNCSSAATQLSFNEPLPLVTS